LNVWSSSRWSMNLHISVTVILFSVVWLIISKVDCALTSCFRIISWEFAVQLFLFLFLFKFLSFFFFFIFLLVLTAKNNTALVVILTNWDKMGIYLWSLASILQPNLMTSLIVLQDHSVLLHWSYWILQYCLKFFCSW